VETGPFILEILIYLRTAGLMLWGGEQDGDTALHVSVSWGHLQICQLLLHRGALPNVKNKAKKTPLDLASAGGFHCFSMPVVQQTVLLRTIINGDKITIGVVKQKCKRMQQNNAIPIARTVLL
jgi:ankyrin repeat protein